MKGSGGSCPPTKKFEPQREHGSNIFGGGKTLQATRLEEMLQKRNLVEGMGAIHFL